MIERLEKITLDNDAFLSVAFATDKINELIEASNRQDRVIAEILYGNLVGDTTARLKARYPEDSEFYSEVLHNG